MTHPEHARTLVEAIKQQGLQNVVMVGAGFERVYFIEGGHEAWPFDLDYPGM